MKLNEHNEYKMLTTQVSSAVWEETECGTLDL